MPVMKIEVALDSDAMVNNESDELALMLGKFILRVQEEPAWDHMNLFDSNGNNVGQCWKEED